MSSPTRVTADDVKVIIDTKYTDVRIQSVIDIASEQVDGLASSTCHTVASLKTVELWLSAHYIAINEQRTSSKKLGDASVGYSRPSVLSTGFNSTFYGQQALNADCSGELANAGKSKVNINFFGGA